MNVPELLQLSSSYWNTCTLHAGVKLDIFFPALFSLNMLIGTPSGQAYSQQEIATIMAGAGGADIRRLQLDLPNGAGVMVGTAAIKNTYQ